MGALIGQLLPVAIGIAISPVTIIAAILMLMSPKARETSLGFLLGIVGGVLTVSSVFAALSSVLPASGSGDGSWARALIQVVLGALLLFLAVKQWRGRPAPGEEASLPRWMRAIDRFSFGKALGLGFLLGGVNPKNLLLGASAGVTIGAADLGWGASAATIVAYVLLAASTVLIPVLAHMFASRQITPWLDLLRLWLTQHNGAIMATLFVVLGMNVLGKGISGLF
ncbi:MAG: GAP family protein [Leucobacter sp.]